MCVPTDHQSISMYLSWRNNHEYALRFSSQSCLELDKTWSNLNVLKTGTGFGKLWNSMLWGLSCRANTVAHSCNPSSCEVEQKDDELKARLGYIVKAYLKNKEK